jgi:hypothetical protein
MLTIWGIVLAALGILVSALAPRLLPKASARTGTVPALLGAVLILLGTGMQVYEAWWKLPSHCRSLLSLTCPPAPPAPSRRR